MYYLKKLNVYLRKLQHFFAARWTYSHSRYFYILTPLAFAGTKGTHFSHTSYLHQLEIYLTLMRVKSDKLEPLEAFHCLLTTIGCQFCLWRMKLHIHLQVFLTNLMDGRCASIFAAGFRVHPNARIADRFYFISY
jgi:hypothetical protein